MKRLVLIALLCLPVNLYAGNLDLTFSVEGDVKKGEAVLTLNDHLEVFYEEARNHKKRATETVRGVTFSFSFDLKKGGK